MGDSAPPLQDAVTVTGPCWPAAGPVIFFVTVSDPTGIVALLYVSVMLATAVPLAVISTVCGLPSVTTCTARVPPLPVSVTVQVEPAAIPG